MTIFDLLFLAAFLASVITLAVAAYAAVRGRVPRAFSILRVWLVCAAVYLGASAAVAYVAPQRVIATGQPWCFDDWCLTVARATREGTNYTVDLLISSEAKRVTQRANGAWIYLRDENDTHYNPAPDPAEVPWTFCCNPANRSRPSARFRCPRTSASWVWLPGTAARPAA